MKTTFHLLAATLLGALAFISARAADVTPAEARAIAKDAYIFSYPLALQYRTMYVQAIDPKSKEYVGGFGKYRHYGMSSPDNKDIVTPNNDTPYSWAWVDLRAEPWVLTLPKTDGRFFTTEWMDLWHFVLDNWPVWVEGADKTVDIFRYVNFLLPLTTPNPLDQPILTRMAKIGIAPGQLWNPEQMDPITRQAIEDGVADGLKLVNDTIPTVRDAAKFFGNREKIKTDYLNRTLGVVMGQWGNVSQQSVYQTWPADSDGKPLDASKSNYTITFPPGKLPKAKFFWSITMYNLPERLLVDNPIKRYSIGSNTPSLQKASDGSVTIYIQKDSPGPDKEGNWLPAPNAPFYAVLRVYGPGEAEQTGKWKAPVVERTK